MAGVNDLSFKLTADVRDLEQGLNTAQKSLAKTATEANKLDSTLLKGANGGIKQSGAVLTDFNRIVQDLPFGFVGIQNNLGPLTESFGRLKEQTGSTGGALKALVSSLAGAGGFGFALSVVSSLITFATLGLSAWTRGFGNSKTAIDENTKSLKEAADAYKKIVSSVAQEVSKVEILVEAFKKENITRKEKQNIIEQLQNISPAYFSNLSKEKSSVEDVTRAYDAYSRSIVRSIELKVREGQLQKVIEERLALQDKSTRLTNIEVDENGKLRKSISAIWDADATGRKKSFENRLLTEEEQKRLNDLIRTEKELLSGISNLQLPQDFIKVDKVKKDIKSISDVLLELSREIDFFTAKGFAFNTDETKGKIQAITSAVERLIKDFKVAPDDTLIAKLLGTSLLGGQSGLPSNIPGAEGLRERYIKDLQQVLSKPGGSLTVTVPIIPKIEVGLSELKNQFFLRGEELRDALRKGLNSGLENMFENFVSQIGEELGNAISGISNAGDFFKGLFNVLGAGLKQLGQYFIQTAIEVEIFKEFITKNPYLALAAGVALIAIGAAIQNATAKKKAFASGGLVPGTGNRDSVDALLMPGEYVLTKAAVSRIGVGNLEAMNRGIVPSAASLPGISSGSMEHIVYGVIRGEDIYISNQRTGARRGRQG